MVIYNKLIRIYDGSVAFPWNENMIVKLKQNSYMHLLFVSIARTPPYLNWNIVYCILNYGKIIYHSISTPVPKLTYLDIAPTADEAIESLTPFTTTMNQWLFSR